METKLETNELENTNFPGALDDVRSEELKAKDWHKDLASSVDLVWKEKAFRDIKTFPVRNQDGSGSCVAQTLALMLGIENFLEEERFIEFSAKDIYTRRTNTGMGMWGVEALTIVKNYGCTLEELIPSQNQGETEMNKIVREISDLEIAKIFKIKDFYQLPFSVNQIATIMEQGRKNGVAKPVMVWFKFPRAEWTAVPEISNSNYDIVHHSVTAIDYGILNGKKGIFIQDSWGLHSSTADGLRFIGEDYLKRMTFCAYVNDLNNDHQIKPQIKIERTLRKGMTGDDVKELQRLLNITSDGIFGEQTKQVVISFQRNNGLTPDGIVGKNTINKLYGASSEALEEKTETIGDFLNKMTREEKKTFIKGVIDTL